MNNTSLNLSAARGESYDLIVCGGGPSGISAALAGARAGLKTLLIEQTGQLGGVGTSAGVSHLLGGRSTDLTRWAVGGIFREIVEDLAERGGAIHPETIAACIAADETAASPFGFYPGKGSLAAGVPFDPIQMVALLDEKMLEAGVDVLFFTSFVDAEVENNRVKSVTMFNKGGLQSVSCRAVVDATGDADVAARSGCEFVKGRDEDGLMTPATLMFHVDRVEQNALLGHMTETRSFRFRELIQELREQGKWPFSYDIFIGIQLNEPGTLMINTTRICDVDGTDGKSLSRGMMQGRAEVAQLFALMKAHFPGFENARIKSVAPVLGIRETRRIRGEFVMSVEDVVEERDFPDVIGFSAYGWDLPDPKRPSHQPMHETNRHIGDHTPIPFRVMVPRPIENVICPGRAISVERDVLGPLREQAPCMAMGQAAGTAAVQVVRDDVAFKTINVARLRCELEQNGAIIEWSGHNA